MAAGALAHLQTGERTDRRSGLHMIVIIIFYHVVDYLALNRLQHELDIVCPAILS